jgi:hypothetical protein
MRLSPACGAERAPRRAFSRHNFANSADTRSPRHRRVCHTCFSLHLPRAPPALAPRTRTVHPPLRTPPRCNPAAARLHRAGRGRARMRPLQLHCSIYSCVPSRAAKRRLRGCRWGSVSPAVTCPTRLAHIFPHGQAARPRPQSLGPRAGRRRPGRTLTAQSQWPRRWRVAPPRTEGGLGSGRLLLLWGLAVSRCRWACQLAGTHGPLPFFLLPCS